jgi:hypothetical protein
MHMNVARRLWPALLGAPTLVLVDLVVRYALVPPACHAQAAGWTHPVAIVFIAVAAGLLVQSTLELRRLGASPPGKSGDDAGDAANAPGARTLFLARLAAGLAALSLVTLVALWVPAFFLSPCLN